MTTDPAKRVPKSLGTDAKLFGSYTLTDLAVGLFPGVLVVLATQIGLAPTTTVLGIHVQTIALPVAGLAIVAGLLFVYLTPSYTSSVDWLAAMLSYRHRSSEHTFEAAKPYTQVERVHADADAIERSDGAFVGFVQVNPPMLALATDDEWKRTTTEFAEFLNTTVDFPVQFYSTTRPFPVEECLDRYRVRLHDPDVQSNPRLSALIENYTDWYADELDDRHMTIRDHYVVVPVDPADVQFDRESAVDQLARIPLLGLIVRALAAPPIETQRAILGEILDERVDSVVTGLRAIEGCNANRVPATDATALVDTFWTGENNPQGDLECRLRTTPIITTQE